MHARDLVELAALLTTQGPALVARGMCIPAGALQQYWAASRARLDHWSKRLKVLGRSKPAGEKVKFPHVRAVIEEILLSEVLARVWTAVLHAYDDARQVREAEPIARAALLGHLDIRNRALAMLVASTVVTAEDAAALNRLRRRVERWTDCLLGFLMLHADVVHLAVDAERVRDFADDMRHQMQQKGADQVMPLTLAALKNAFQVGVHERPISAEYNQRLASMILACLPPDAFEATDVFPSLWVVRLMNITNEAQGMIEELLAEGSSSATKCLPRR